MKLKSLNRLFIIQSIIVVCFSLVPYQLIAQRLVDKNKGNHNNTKSGLMDVNVVSTVYHNFGEVADWLIDTHRSGVWQKCTNHS